MRATLGVLAIAGCHATTSAVVPASSLRSVDWNNREYPGSGGKLVDGHAEVRAYPAGGGGHLTIRTDFVDVAFADLDGDGVEEAVVALRSSADTPNGPHGPDGTVLVYATRDGGVDEIASYATDAPRSLRVHDRKIFVDAERCTIELTLTRDAGTSKCR